MKQEGNETRIVVDRRQKTMSFQTGDKVSARDTKERAIVIQVDAWNERLYCLTEGGDLRPAPLNFEDVGLITRHGLDAHALALVVASCGPITYEAVVAAGERLHAAAILRGRARIARAAGAVAGAIGWAALCGPPADPVDWRQWAAVAVGMLAVSWAGQAAAGAAWLWLAGWTRLMEEWADA